MSEKRLNIELSRLLKKHNAVVLYGGKEKKGYTEIAGGFGFGEEISIAIPDKYLDKSTNDKTVRWLNKLCSDAQLCLIKAINRN